MDHIKVLLVVGRKRGYHQTSCFPTVFYRHQTIKAHEWLGIERQIKKLGTTREVFTHLHCQTCRQGAKGSASRCWSLKLFHGGKGEAAKLTRNYHKATRDPRQQPKCQRMEVQSVSQTNQGASPHFCYSGNSQLNPPPPPPHLILLKRVV